MLTQFDASIDEKKNRWDGQSKMAAIQNHDVFSMTTSITYMYSPFPPDIGLNRLQYKTKGRA